MNTPNSYVSTYIINSLFIAMLCDSAFKFVPNLVSLSTTVTHIVIITSMGLSFLYHSNKIMSAAVETNEDAAALTNAESKLRVSAGIGIWIVASTLLAFSHQYYYLIFCAITIANTLYGQYEIRVKIKERNLLVKI